MRRRRLLMAGAALAGGTVAGLPWLAGPLGRALAVPPPDDVAGASTDPAVRTLLDATWDGLDPARLRDTHVHLLGNGDAGSGCTVHPDTQRGWHPVERLRRAAILAAAGVPLEAASLDRAYVAALRRRTDAFPTGARWWLFAFTAARDDAGRVQPDWTTFQVPDAYAAQVAAAHPGRFDWVASVHPYADDAPSQLDQAAAAGAVAMKWLPSAMNIDLADRRCEAVYARLRRHGLPLIVHGGDEHAVPGAGRQGLGHPLRLRHPLDQGLTVIAAHCASLGDAPDTDRRSAPDRPAFEFFARLMDERGHAGRLLGDVSGVFQRNRRPAVWRAVLARRDWHHRLVHGSDHPLPGVVPLFSPAALAGAGLLAEDAVRPLEILRRQEPLLFDLALKRHLRADGTRLPAAVFEARALVRTAPRPPAAT